MATTVRQVRISDDLWQRFGQVAANRGLSRSELVRAYIEHEIERSESATGDLFDSALPSPLSGSQSTRGKR